MLIVYWPMIIKFRTCQQTSRAQTNTVAVWGLVTLRLIGLFLKTITSHEYFWCSRFCEFHSINCSHYMYALSLKKNASQNIIKWTTILTLSMKKWCWGDIAKAVYFVFMQAMNQPPPVTVNFPCEMTFAECSSTEILYR